MIRVCGVDEAGRGPLAGPVTAAAVILDPARPIDGLADSKKLSPAASRSGLSDPDPWNCALAMVGGLVRQLSRNRSLEYPASHPGWPWQRALAGLAARRRTRHWSMATACPRELAIPCHRDRPTAMRTEAGDLGRLDTGQDHA
jgi:hypothetical protein